MRNSIILLDENKKTYEYAYETILDRKVVEYMIYTLQDAGLDNIIIVAKDQAKVDGAKVVQSLEEAIKVLGFEGDLLLIDDVYPFLSKDSIELMLEKENARINDTHTIKLKMADLSNIAKIKFDKVMVASRDLEKVESMAKVRELNRDLKAKINTYHLNNGVNLIDPDHTYIGIDVKIEKGVTIEGGVTLAKRTTVKKGSYLTSGTYLANAKIGENTTILASRITDSEVGNKVTIGPNSHLRMHTKVHDEVRIGNFVEFKNTDFGYKSRCAHLTYLGDSIVGEDVNIGCGVVTCNYDGAHKFKTIIGDHSFIGSNANLVAPVKIGSNVLIAAGSTITSDVEEGAMGIARSRQSNKPEYGYKYINKEK